MDRDEKLSSTTICKLLSSERFNFQIVNGSWCFLKRQAYPFSEIKQEQEKNKVGTHDQQRPYFAPKSANYKLIFKPVLNLRCLLLQLTILLGAPDIHSQVNKSNL